MNIRPVQSEADFPGIVAVINAFDTVPITVTQFRDWFQHDMPGQIIRRRVAVNAQDKVIGYSVADHKSHAPEGHFYVWVGMELAWRGRGGGSMLYDEAAAFLRAQGATTLKSEVCDDSPEALHFAEARGFHLGHHMFESILDLAAFDDAPYRAVRAELAAQGIRFCSVADFGDSPAARRKLYEVNRLTSLDEPESDGTFMSFAEFEQWICGAEWYRPAGQIVAVDGEAWVGLAAVQLLPDKAEAYNLMTGVIRSHRGRKIAQGLKLCAVNYARQHGMTRIRTNNDSLNAPMLAINQKMGYQPQPGKYVLCCPDFQRRPAP